MDRYEKYNEIEKLRRIVASEYEKSIDKGYINTDVIDLSQKLDQLIIEYIKMNPPKK